MYVIQINEADSGWKNMIFQKRYNSLEECSTEAKRLTLKWKDYFGGWQYRAVEVEFALKFGNLGITS